MKFDARRVKFLVLGFVGGDVAVNLLVVLEPLHAVDGISAQVVPAGQGYCVTFVHRFWTRDSQHFQAIASCKKLSFG